MILVKLVVSPSRNESSLAFWVKNKRKGLSYFLSRYMNRLDYKYELGELVQICPTAWRGVGRPIHFGFVIRRMKSFNSSYLYKIYWVNDETDERWVPEMDIKKYV